jgi:hypothetical protein
MSETSILPGLAPAPVGAGPTVPMPPEFDDGPGDDRRRLMIIGGIIGVVVVVIAAYLLLHKGSSSPSALPPVPHATQPVTPTGAGGTAAKAGHGKTATAGHGKSSHGKSGHGKSGHGKSKGHHGVTTLPRTSSRQTVRDPFTALVLAPAAGSTQQGATTTVPAPPVAPVVTSTQPSTNTGSGTTGTGTGSSGSGTPVVTTPKSQPLWIRLVSTNGDASATFDVGYSHHKFHRFRVLSPSARARQGTVFDKIFALIGIEHGVVTVQIGDATPFNLVTGLAHRV